MILMFALMFVSIILVLKIRSIAQKDNPKNFYWDSIYNNRPLSKSGEKAISKDAHYSYLYARDVLKRRFELGEEAIIQNDQVVVFYIFNVIKGRFALGEKAVVLERVKKNDKKLFSANKYVETILGYNHQ